MVEAFACSLIHAIGTALVLDKRKDSLDIMFDIL